MGGNWISPESTYLSAAGEGVIYDIWFENDQTNSIEPNADGTTYADNVTVLPDLVGYGNLTGLHAAMAADETLRADVEALIRGAGTFTYAEMSEQIEQFLFRWAGVDTAPTNARGSYVNARHLAFLEQVHGVAVVAAGGGANPGANAGAALESYYDSVVGSMTVRFLAQVNASAHQLWIADGEPGTYSLPVPEFLRLLFDPSTDSLLGSFEDAIQTLVGDAVGEGNSQPDVSEIFEIATLVRLLRTDYFGRTGKSLEEASETILLDAGSSDITVALFYDVTKASNVFSGSDLAGMSAVSAHGAV